MVAQCLHECPDVLVEGGPLICHREEGHEGHHYRMGIKWRQTEEQGES